MSFQSDVYQWMLACFGAEIASDKVERNHRFLEEALELVQSLGCTASEAHQLVDYVFNRHVGEPGQEVGGVIVTLSALCSANNLNSIECGDTELQRIWTKIEKIRAKQAAKPKYSPLPEAVADSQPAERDASDGVDFAKIEAPFHSIEGSESGILDDETIIKISREYFAHDEFDMADPSIQKYLKAVRHCLSLQERNHSDHLAACMA